MPSQPPRLAVSVDDVDTDPPSTDAAHDGAQRSSGTATAADHLAEIIGMDVYLERSTSPRGDQLDAHIVGIVDNPPHEMLQRVHEHAHTRPPAVVAVSSRSSAGA